MFGSILFRRVFLSILIIFLIYVGAIYFFTVPLIKKSVYGIEKDSANTILENVYHIIKNEFNAIQSYRSSRINSLRKQLINITLLQKATLENKNALFVQNILTGETAKHSALEELSAFNYGSSFYIWVCDSGGKVLLSPADNLSTTGNPMNKVDWKSVLQDAARTTVREEECFTDFNIKADNSVNYTDNISYSVYFSEWDWVVGTAVPLKKINEEYELKKKNLVENLRRQLRDLKIARTGYVYIFDGNINMLVHPNSNIEGTNFNRLLNPLTQKPIGKELIFVSQKKNPRLYYKWDKPDDKGNYIYEKISWVKYFKPLDWYVASSVYTEELNSTPVMLQERILLVSGVIFFVLVAVAGFFSYKFLDPVKKLSRAAEEIKNGNFFVRCEIKTRDEMGTLADAFNSMVEQLSENILMLDRKVRERTEDLLSANQELVIEIEEHERDLEALRQSEERYRTIIENIEDGYFEVDLKGNMIFCNDSLAKFLLYKKEEMIGKNYREIMDKENAEKIFKTFNKTFTTGKPAKAFDWELLRKDGKRIYIETSVTLIHDFQENPVGFRGIARDVTKRKEHEMRLIYLAYHDLLTGLYNREAFLKRLNEILRHAERYNEEKTVFFLDLDHFKQVNDTHGHWIGDKLLKHVAIRLKNLLRETDVVSRFGGDEFAVILSNPGESRPENVAERILEHVSEPYIIENIRIDYISTSIGFSIYPRHGKDVVTLMQCADEAMYKAKEKGNCFIQYRQGSDPQYRE